MPTMYDTTDPEAIPASAGTPDYTAGYVDGHWPTYAGMIARYPTAVPVAITAIPGSANAWWAHVCDCEDGDYTPSQAAAWAHARIGLGFRPALYCSLALWSTVEAACARAGVLLGAVDWILAAYPGNGQTLYPGTVGHQWIDHGPYDESVIVTGWTPGRATHAPITPKGTEEMIASTPTGKGYWICKSDGSVWSYGDAQYLGGTNPGAKTPMLPGRTVVGFAVPTTKAQGYWIETDHGELYTFGSAPYLGAPGK